MSGNSIYSRWNDISSHSSQFIALEGPGVHSGEIAEVAFTIRPGEEENYDGPRFIFPGFNRPIPFRDLKSFGRSALRSTILTEGQATIATPEHLLGVLILFRELPLDIYCSSAELPGLDGSGRDFYETIRCLQEMEGLPFAPKWKEYPSELIWEHHWEGGFIKTAPSPAFSICYSLKKGSLSQSFQFQSPSLSDPFEPCDRYIDEVMQARTFITYADFRRIKLSEERGLSGAGIDSGLLLAENREEFARALTEIPGLFPGPFPLLNQPAWRTSDELAKHKIFDFIGDLAILDLSLPKLKVEVRNGGHLQNHLLLEKLIDERISGKLKETGDSGFGN